MSRFFYRGIMLQQHKEPALSRELREFLNADTIGLRMNGEPIGSLDTLTADEIIVLARQANIIDEHDGDLLADKLFAAREKNCHLILVDAIDDEPYISSQINPLLKNPHLSQVGLTLCQRAVGTADACFAVYKNLTDLETKILHKIGDYPVIRMRGRYPAELQAVNDYRQDAGALMIGAGSVIHLARAALFHKPQTTTFVTVAGDCISNPTNLEVSLGITAMQTLERCGLIEQPNRVVVGGSMTGISVIDTENTLITPTTRAILAFRLGTKDTSHDCIGCARCVTACPQGLNPFMIYRAIRHDRQDMLRRLDASACISCGACSYMCPARLELSDMIVKAVRNSEEKHAEIEKSYSVLQISKNAVYENYLANHRFGKAVKAHTVSRRRLLRNLMHWESEAAQQHQSAESAAKRRLDEAFLAFRRAQQDSANALENTRQQLERDRAAADRKLESVVHARDTVHHSADRAMQNALHTRQTSEHAADKMVKQSIAFQKQLSQSTVREAERALALLEKSKDPISPDQLKQAQATLLQARESMDQEMQQAQTQAEQNCARSKADALAAYTQAGVICEKNKQDADQTVVAAQVIRQQEYNKAQAAFEEAQKLCEQSNAAAQVVLEQEQAIHENAINAETLRYEKAQALLHRKALIEQAIIDETLHLIRFEALAAAHKAAHAQAAVSARACLPDDYKMPSHLRQSEVVLLSPVLRLPYDREGYPVPNSAESKDRIKKTIRKLLEMTPEQIAVAIEICTASLANPPVAEEAFDPPQAQTDGTLSEHTEQDHVDDSTMAFAAVLEQTLKEETKEERNS